MNKQPKATEQTRKNIVQAFWKLFKKKRIDQITVKEISYTAGYNRSTFYVYFTNIRDILEQEEEILISYIQKNASEVLFPSLVKGIKPEATQLFFYTKREYLKILLGENGDPQFLIKLKKAIFPAAFNALGLQQNNSYDGYVFDFCFPAVLSVMLHWYEHENLTIDELLVMLWSMLTKGALSEYQKISNI